MVTQLEIQRCDWSMPEMTAQRRALPSAQHVAIQESPNWAAAFFQKEMCNVPTCLLEYYSNISPGMVHESAKSRDGDQCAGQCLLSEVQPHILLPAGCRVSGPQCDDL